MSSISTGYCAVCQKKPVAPVLVCETYELHVCSTCIPDLDGERSFEEMECLIHHTSLCGTNAPFHVYLQWLKSMQILNYDETARRLSLKLHLKKCLIADSAELVTCPKCSATGSLLSDRLTPWSTLECPQCYHAFCCKCHNAVALLPRMESGISVRGLDWRFSNSYAHDFVCACGRPSDDTIETQVRRRLAKLSSGHFHAVPYSPEIADVINALGTVDDSYILSSPCMKALLEVPRFACVADKMGLTCDWAGMEVLDWLQDEAAGYSEVDTTNVVRAWLLFIHPIPASNCLRKHPFWSVILERLGSAHECLSSVRLHPAPF